MNETRVRRLQVELQQGGFSHAVFAPGASFYYLTGIRAHQSERLTLLGLDREGNAALLLPRLEAESAGDLSGYQAALTYADDEGPGKALEQFVALLGMKGGDHVAAEPLNLRLFEARLLEDAGVRTLRSSAELVMRLRLIKDDAELAAIKKAAAIVDQALQQALSLFKIGMSETELAAELELQMRRLGSEGVPFSTIVGAGERGALPHGMPSGRKVRGGDLVVLDYGAMVDGYAADTTRTLAFGEVDEKARRVYGVVKEAQATALRAIRPGATASQVDEAARGVIAAAGFGDYFTHRTGHGLGLDVHEFPSIVGGNDLLLVPGMVFTVEPGIYLPGELGVRIEDDVVVTADGAETLTSFTKELTVVDR